MTYHEKVLGSFVEVPWLSGVPVSIEEDGAEEKIDIGRERANLWFHLTFVPHCWTCETVTSSIIINSGPYNYVYYQHQ